MQANDTVNPPHLGFETSVIKASEKFNAYVKKTLKHIEIQLNIKTSTPYKKIVEIMDVSFTKYYQNMFQTNTQIDNDSGYVSHNHESNSDSTLDTLNESARIIVGNSDVKTVYLCEDALLEKPDVCTNTINNINHPVKDEDATFSNSIEIIQKSVSTEKERFSILQDSDVSYLSNVSDVIPEIIPIEVRPQLSILNDRNIICDISNDSNIENNMNSLNVDLAHTTKISKCTSINDICLRGISRPLNGFSNDTVCNLHTHPGDSLFSFNLSVDRTRTKNKTVVSNECNVNKKKLQTPKKSYRNLVNPNYSPDLFSDDDVDTKVEVVVARTVPAQEKYVHKHDCRLLKRVQKSLSGVLPPPSFTTINLTATQILDKIEKNNHLFLRSNSSLGHKFGCEANGSDLSTENNENAADNSARFKGSLLITSSLENCLSKPWPSIMEERFHGLHYNRSKLSEEFETLCMKYGMRYVSSETQSTCTVIETTMSSPSKRKASKLRWCGVKSPGRRLSHLARRRITFSSANLQASSSSSVNSRQVMMDSKRLELLTRKRSPKKRTPRKSPRKSPRKRIRTPSSSAKKRLSLQLQMISENRENSDACSSTLKATTTKRALFQSPEHNRPGTSLSKPVFPSTSGNSGLSPYKKRNNTKCVLFSSPLKKSPFKFDNKRKRTDSEDFHPSKLPRSLSLQETSKTSSNLTRLSSANSEMNLNTTQMTEMSTHHKKKLQWAVYEALRSQNIGMNHPGFKSFACVLARVTRRFLPNLSASAPRPEGGTSQRMLRIAKQHVFAVSKGKSLDQILQDAAKIRLKNIKPIGYVSVEDAAKNDVSMARNKVNILRDKVNTISNEKSQPGLGFRTVVAKSENKIDRVRKVINFDEDSHIGSSGVR